MKNPELPEGVTPVKDMTELERIQALNRTHTIIHKIDKEKIRQTQNINNIMAFMAGQEKTDG